MKEHSQNELPATAETSPAPPAKQTELRYVHSANLADLLAQLRATLLISTYQAGQLVSVGVADGKLAFSFHAFRQVMGVAPRPDRIAVGCYGQIDFLDRAMNLGPQIEPAGRYDACYLARRTHHTGPIHIHELHWGGEELWFVNTLFSCLCTLGENTSFVPRWKPGFVSQIADQDRCHLNGLAMENGRPRYVTVLAETDTPAGWRESKATSGAILDVPSGEVVMRGLSMPHSVRCHDGRVWVLDSGRGALSIVEPQAGRAETVAHLPGYTRGLTFLGPIAFVGLSRIRETNVFGGLPISEQRENLECGVSIVDTRSGQRLGHLTFESGVEEIFDVQLLPTIQCPMLQGPAASNEGQKHVWLADQPRWLVAPSG